MTLGLKVGFDMMRKYDMCNRYCRTRPALSESLFSILFNNNRNAELLEKFFQI